MQPTSSTDQRRYIDPGNYLDLMELITTFTMELDRSDTKLEGVIGQGKCHFCSFGLWTLVSLFFVIFSLCVSGEFADVYKGTLKSREGKQVVAVKVLRVSCSLYVRHNNLLLVLPSEPCNQSC